MTLLRTVRTNLLSINQQARRLEADTQAGSMAVTLLPGVQPEPNKKIGKATDSHSLDLHPSPKPKRKDKAWKI